MRWTVPESVSKTRLDLFLLDAHPDQSRSQIQQWIRSGMALVNGMHVKTGYQLRPGDLISLETIPVALPSLEPENIPLNVLHEDRDIAIIDKPAGIVCHAGAGVRSGTLVNALLYRFGSLSAADANRPGIVHRLDKSTSGLMIIARTISAHRSLAAQFRSREVRKEYIALVYGHPNPASGTIDLPLGRDTKDRKKISVRAKRSRSAITHYLTERSYPEMALLRVRIETGRTHQIRVHLAHKGHPVVGDALYGGKRHKGLPQRLQPILSNLTRIFLHASHLEFIHPVTGDKMALESPLPAELQEILDLLSLGPS